MYMTCLRMVCPMEGRLSLYTSQVAHQARAYPGFCNMKRLGVFLLPPQDGMLVHRRVTPSIKFAITHLYTWIERGISKYTTQCPQPGLEPGPLDPETSALTMRPPSLPCPMGWNFIIQWSALLYNNFLWRAEKPLCSQGQQTSGLLYKYRYLIINAKVKSVFN